MGPGCPFNTHIKLDQSFIYLNAKNELRSFDHFIDHPDLAKDYDSLVAPLRFALPATSNNKQILIESTTTPGCFQIFDHIDKMIDFAIAKEGQKILDMASGKLDVEEEYRKLEMRLAEEVTQKEKAKATRSVAVDITEEK